MKRNACLSVLFVILLSTPLFSSDMLRYQKMEEGKAVSEETLSGTVKSVNDSGIEFTENGKNQTIPTNLIVWVQYDGEPIQLTTARTLYQTSQYDQVLTKLSEISSTERKKISAPILLEVEYYTAAATAMIALSRQTNEDMAQAGRLLLAFIKKYPKSWHLLSANELVGSILLAMKKPGQARPFFDRLAEYPWPDVRLKAQIASGNIALDEGKPDEARKSFESVLAFKAEDSPLVQEQKIAAELGLARVLIADKKYDEAVKELSRVIMSTQSPPAVLSARLYNMLGDAYRLSGNVRSAILAYLHTDLLYSGSRPEHVAALRELYPLWRAISHEDRAEQVLKTLRNEYKVTP